MAVIFTLKAKGTSKVGTCSRVGGSIQANRKAVHHRPGVAYLLRAWVHSLKGSNTTSSGGDGVVKNKVRFLPSGAPRDLPSCSRIFLLKFAKRPSIPRYVFMRMDRCDRYYYKKAH